MSPTALAVRMIDLKEKDKMSYDVSVIKGVLG